MRVADFVVPTATVRLRFSADDNPNDSITEAAVDGVRVFDAGCPGGIPGDLNGDGAVDIDDLLILLAAWGPCPDPPDPCPADLDEDGSVGIGDLLNLLANWT